ncbi:GNAT family N-acetyltransferase [Anaerosphaera multitolerans]|uniref:GNAT family N-acetyltransferase n=1 Tax=Anaerosphaera multitolerans TaxID=2487351 RepID=A0A437S5M5_9FIRM|nr:GNAT family N-acetyltransferase [Anaerosphaera multitolerans]RVU54335.1 GNAT family N-acetyltransferase [Anaerosphaera multitolerans]
MFEIKYSTEADKTFWFSLDTHISNEEFLLKVRDKRSYIIYNNSKPIGIMRYNLFWDNIPFLTLICLDKFHLRKGFGKQALLFWEKEMRELGYKLVVTSTQIDEDAQHFYRKLGYVEKGSLSFDNTPLEQAMEVFFLKNL